MQSLNQELNKARERINELQRLLNERQLTIANMETEIVAQSEKAKKMAEINDELRMLI